jgi:hypothetical protein
MDVRRYFLWIFLTNIHAQICTFDFWSVWSMCICQCVRQRHTLTDMSLCNDTWAPTSKIMQCFISKDVNACTCTCKRVELQSIDTSCSHIEGMHIFPSVNGFGSAKEMCFRTLFCYKENIDMHTALALSGMRKNMLICMRTRKKLACRER